MRGVSAALVVGLLLWGCGEEAKPPPEGPPPEDPPGNTRALSLTAEVDQPTAPVASQLRVTATVQVAGALQQTGGQLVNFVVVSGGGAVFAGSAMTDAAGTAREVWTLGKTAGEQVLEVRAVDQATGAPITHARVVVQATPGEPFNCVLYQDQSTVASGAPFDWVASTHSIGWDAHGNQVDVAPQCDATFVRFQLSSENPPFPGATRPSCTIEGSIVRCTTWGGERPEWCVKSAGCPVARWTMLFASPYWPESESRGLVLEVVYPSP